MPRSRLLSAAAVQAALRPAATALANLVGKCLPGGVLAAATARARAPREEYRMDAIADLQLMTRIVISERMFLDHFPSVLVRRVAWLRSGMHAKRAL